MLWLVIIGAVVTAGIASRSAAGTRVLGRFWLVASAVWIVGVFALGAAGPGDVGPDLITALALLPPIAALVLVRLVAWIGRAF
ncbi:MAG: hypothetical protein ACREE4_03825 [Stellaceae bacterium]